MKTEKTKEKTPQKGFSLKELVEKYHQKETKGSIENSLLKGLVDSVSGGIIGPSVAAVTGKYAQLAGLALILIGHYSGDKTGVLRMTGAGALGYGIAKAKQYQEEADIDTVQKRMSGLKSDLLASAYLKWKKEEDNKKGIKQEEEPQPKQTEPTQRKSQQEEIIKTEEKKVPETGQRFDIGEKSEQKNEALNQVNKVRPPLNIEPEDIDDTPDLTYI